MNSGFLRLVTTLLVTCSSGLAAFTCDGGTTVLEAHRINDDYCDCTIDGMDETRTPACSHTGNTRFVCTATGALNQTIPMSRVWDGVCDCCDGSDELRVSGALAGLAAPCDRSGCKRLLGEAQAHAIQTYRRVKIGFESRPGAEAEGRRALARWESVLKAEDMDEEACKIERKAVEKLEVLLKVYLQDEERLERRERKQLADQGGCHSRGGGRSKAAALGPCDDNTADGKAAAKVRAARAAARARHDAEAKRKEDKRRGKGNKTKKKSEPGGGETTVEQILDLRWPVVDGGDATDSGGVPGGDRRAGSNEGDGEEGNGGDTGQGAGGGGTLSLRSYVRQRQKGSAAKAAAQTEEAKAEELRKTALLGPVLNDGERGVYLGLTILLRLAGLVVVAPARGVLTICWFIRDRAAEAAAAAATRFGLPSPLRVALEGYRDRGLAGISPHLDYRRYPMLRACVLRWDEFLGGSGAFLLVMWDSPVALWDLFFPELDNEHERPEAGMLREGIARAKASLQKRETGGSKSGHGQRGRELTEVRRLSELDLGEGASFAELAETCLDLQEGGYTYSLCPFKEAKQDKHNLGKWKGWGPEQGKDGHRSMLFDKGSRCHNRKQRSAEVLLECGPHDALIAAEELEIGVYRLAMETPLACSETNLEEAQYQLELHGVSISDTEEADTKGGDSDANFGVWIGGAGRQDEL